MQPNAEDLTIYDVVIVGAGPAGLSAALVLGRACDRVLLLDDGRPRNHRAHASHGFFTRDGDSPEHLRRLGLDQLRPYDVSIQACRVTEIDRHADGLFAVRSEARMWFGRKVLLATGMQEADLAIPGVSSNIGEGVYCCPYCDGWEVRNGALGGLAIGPGAAEYAITLLTWSRSVTLLTHGEALITPAERARLARHGVNIVEERIEYVEVEAPRRVRVQLLDRGSLRFDALFLHVGQHQPSPLAAAAGCTLTHSEAVRAHAQHTTEVPGLYVAGDAQASVESLAVAAAEGYRAALAIHRELLRERFGEAQNRLAHVSQ